MKPPAAAAKEVAGEQSKTQLEPLQHLPLQAEEMQIPVYVMLGND